MKFFMTFRLPDNIIVPIRETEYIGRCHERVLKEIAARADRGKISSKSATLTAPVATRREPKL